MASQEKQESGRMLGSSISQSSPESFTIPTPGSTSNYLVSSENHNVLNDAPFLEIDLPGDAAIGLQLETESPVLAQIPTTSSASLSSKSQSPTFPANEKSKSERTGDKVLPTQESSSMSSDEASGSQSRVSGASPNLDKIRRPSLFGHECPSIADKVEEMNACSLMPQNGSAEYSTSDTAAGVTTVSMAASLAEVSSVTGHGSPNQHVPSKPRTENLPRLALLDLPLLGITPPCQDTSDRPQRLEGIQEAPLSAASAMRSPTDQDPKATGQASGMCHSPRQKTCPPSETSIRKVGGSDNTSAQTDDDVDDEVTFIVSVPRRRKKRKRIEFPTNPSVEELGKTNSSVRQEKGSESPRPRGLTPVAKKYPSVPQKPAIPDKQHAIPTDRSNSSCLPALVRAAPQTAQIGKSSQANAKLDGVNASGGAAKVASSAENSIPVITEAAGATGEAAQIKRKVGQSDGQENEPPIKRAKIGNVKQDQGRSAVSPANHGHREISTTPLIGCATILNPSVATSLSTGSPGISNSQLHGRDASNLVQSHNQTAGSTNGATSAQADNLPMPVIGRTSVPGNIRDVHRKPSLYSIPVWSSSPISSSTPGGQQKITVGASLVTQTTKSPPTTPGQSLVPQYAQRSNFNNSISSSTSQSSSSSQLRTGNPQTSFIPRSLDNYSRSGQSLGAQTVYAISPWPPGQRLLTTGQQVQQGFLPSQTKHFTFTPQEYARILQAQQAQQAQAAKTGESQQLNSGATVSPQMRRTESLPQNSSSPNTSQTADESQTSPSPNLLVDIAQTCQAIFPFARIAERHNQPVKKVFDAFSAVIQIPLLQCAADRRRNGKLGTARLKKFREVQKAVGEQHEKERKAEKQGAKMRNELAEPPPKRPKGRPPKSAAAKGLLGMALANSQKNANGSK